MAATLTNKRRRPHLERNEHEKHYRLPREPRERTLHMARADFARVTALGLALDAAQQDAVIAAGMAAAGLVAAFSNDKP